MITNGMTNLWQIAISACGPVAAWSKAEETVVVKVVAETVVVAVVVAVAASTTATAPAVTTAGGQRPANKICSGGL